MYAPVCTCVRVCKYVHVCVWVCVYACVNVCVCVGMCACVYRPYVWVCGYACVQGQEIAFWKARQRNMTSVSSAVRDYDCLRASSCRMECMQASVCFLLRGLQLRHFHPFICCHLEAGFFAYPWIAVVSTRQPIIWWDFVLLKELHRNFLHCCMLCPPARHLYWSVVLARRFMLSEYLTDVKDNTNPTTLSTTYSAMDKTDSVTWANICCCHSSFIPSMMQVDGIGIASASAGDKKFSSSLARSVIFVFRKDPSAFASAPGNVAMAPVDRTSFMFTLLLSATRIIWLKRFLSAFTTTCWPFILDVLCR